MKTLLIYVIHLKVNSLMYHEVTVFRENILDFLVNSNLPPLAPVQTLEQCVSVCVSACVNYVNY